MEKIKNHILLHRFWLSVFITLFVFFWLTPLTGDDLIFLSYSRSLSSTHSFIDSIFYMYENINGRVMGNGLSVLLAESRVVSAIVRAGITICIMILILKISKIKSITVRNILVAVLFFVPLSIFVQTYAWRAGFYNYVTPVALILVISYIVKTRLFEGKKHKAAIFAPLLLALGFVSCLFVENMTVGIVVLSFAAVLVYVIKYKKIQPSLLTLVIGSILGAIVMFSSPVYRTIATGNDSYSYRQVGSETNGLIGSIRDNSIPFVHFLVSNNSIMYLMLSIACLLTVAKKGFIKTRWRYEGLLQNALIIALIVGPVYFAITWYVGDISRLSNIGIYAYAALNLLITLIYFTSVCLILGLAYISKEKKLTALFFVISALVFVAPLLVVTPFGGRNFYVSYVFILSSTLLLIDPMILKIKSQQLQGIIKLSSYAVLISATLIYISIFAVIRLREYSNDKYATQQVREGKRVIKLQNYQFSNFIQDPHRNVKVTQLYGGGICLYDKCVNPSRIQVKYH